VSLPAPLPLVVGNWKMNFDEAATASLVADLTRRLSFERAEVAVAPPFPSLRAALDAAAGSLLAIAAQNVHAEDRGAFTGEVAAPMLAAMGNIHPQRLLDPRYLDPDLGDEPASPAELPVVIES